MIYKSFESLREGTTIQFPLFITRDEVKSLCELISDPNPLHQEGVLDFPDIIVPGYLLLLASSAMTHRYIHKPIMSTIMHTSFHRMVYSDTELLVVNKITALRPQHKKIFPKSKAEYGLVRLLRNIYDIADGTLCVKHDVCFYMEHKRKNNDDLQ